MKTVVAAESPTAEAKKQNPLPWPVSQMWQPQAGLWSRWGVSSRCLLNAIRGRLGKAGSPGPQTDDVEVLGEVLRLGRRWGIQSLCHRRRGVWEVLQGRICNLAPRLRRRPGARF